MKRPLSNPIRPQQGATLVVALIFLVILGLLGVTVASNNSLQERMAGNTRNRDLAFQAAEHAMKSGEAFVFAPPDEDPVAAPNGVAWLDAHAVAGDVNGLLNNGEAHPNDMNYWRNTFDWDTAANYRDPVTNLAQVSAQPRYVVEKLPDAEVDAAHAGLEQFYRVTARGIGASGDAIVILQAMYRFN